MQKTSRITLSKGKSKVGGGLLAQLKAEKEVQTGEVLDQRVAGLKDFKLVPPPPGFKDFVEKIAPKIILPRTSYDILTAFSNIDVTAEKVALALKANPYYSFQFFKQIESMGKREEFPSTEGAVILLGMQNSRNLILALQLLRAVSGTHMEWSKEGKLKITPADAIKYALKTEEILAGNKSGYADTAYAAGLMFDVLTMIIDRTVEDKKSALAYLDSVYSHGLQTARIGMELAKHIPDFSFSKFAFSACLIHDIGKAVIAINNGTYLPFAEETVKRGLPRPVRHFAEEKEFGVNHAVLSGLCCHFFRVFKPVGRAIFYHHDPYLLRSVNRNLYQLSCLICLATNMANNIKKVDKLNDPIFAVWKGPELKDFKMDPRGMMAAAAKGI